MARHRIGAALALIAAITVNSGCSVREYAMRSIGDALADGGDTYASDDDIELVGAATPFGLKTIETVLAGVPDHRGLLLAAARGFTQYAYVYVQLPAEEAEERDVAASYAQCAEILDRIGTVPGTKGIMLIFPECVAGLQTFGERVLPLMRTAKLAPPRTPRVRVE